MPLISLSRPVGALPAALWRLWLLLDSPALLRWRWLLPLPFGLLTLGFGQDDNWDFRNYHLYAPFALVHGKVGLDLAPGAWQSYFNPTLDLLYYGLQSILPGPLAGLVMGLLHGVNALLLLAIARIVLASVPGTSSRRAPLLLTLAGCMGCAFFSQLGNSMGDNMTALCVLGALLIVLRHWQELLRADARSVALALLAGLLLGAGTGLKLTNAVYALALCLALLGGGGGLVAPLARAAGFGVGVLGGIALTAGHWYWRMWTQFGNPLFPQFNDLFKAPLAAPIGIGDTRWLPQGWTEKLLWPFVFALNPSRVTEIRMHLWLWPLLYLAFLALALVWWRARRDPAAPRWPEPVRLLLRFFVLAYLGWQLLFSIYRYLVPLELLAPLVLWLLVDRLLAPRLARRSVAALLVLAVLLALPTPHWGRAPWSRQAFSVDTPTWRQPEQVMVLTTQAPVGWYTAGFPAQVAFASVGGSFPGSPAYDERVRSMLRQRSGPYYLLLTSNRPDPARPASAARRQAAQAEDDAARAQAAPSLARLGWQLAPAGCEVRAAYIGRNHNPYQLCAIMPQ